MLCVGLDLFRGLLFSSGLDGGEAELPNEFDQDADAYEDVENGEELDWGCSTSSASRRRSRNHRAPILARRVSNRADDDKKYRRAQDLHESFVAQSDIQCLREPAVNQPRGQHATSGRRSIARRKADVSGRFRRHEHMFGCC
jgi:hypothetical protein